MTSVSYVGALTDSSGYAEAARNHMAALHHVGVKVEAVPVTFESYKAELGRLGLLVNNLYSKNPISKIQILHVTPENYEKLIDKNKYNIGYTVWEADRLPKRWVEQINKLDEVWVPSEHNVSVFKTSGVTIPISCMPHPFNVDYFNEDSQKAKALISNKKSNEFTFYSIFQWLPRKGPEELLIAYLTEFKAEENVSLLIKTYLSNPSSSQEHEKIKQAINEVKAKLYLPSYPKLLLVSSLLSRHQVQSLHLEGDCYISLHSCEGFGIPFVEAMLAKKPVISTGYGGQTDFIKHGETGYLVDYKLTPVYGMPWSHYTGEMKWASPDILHARTLMREVFNNREKANVMGEDAYQFVSNNLSWETVGQKMKNRLEEIERKING